MRPSVLTSAEHSAECRNRERFREFLQPYSERNETVSERAIQDFFTGERERVAANAQRNRDTFF